MKAYTIRAEARLNARQLMANPSEVELLQARDMFKYQNPNGPTFDYLYNSYRTMGYSNEQILQSIIDRSQITSPKFNMGLTR